MLIYLFISIGLLVGSFVIGKWKGQYRNLLLVFNAFVSITYIVWRFTVIPVNNVASFTLGSILFLAEVFGIIQFMTFQYLFVRKFTRVHQTLAAFEGRELPFVDILICTYNEPIWLVEKTILASLDLDYPKDRFCVYVCDDGNRLVLGEICHKYGAIHLTRQGNKGAKAGNINNALLHTKGELFAVLDADMIPKRNFLQETVGFFIEPLAAFVQVPQVYYNQDAYQYNLQLRIPNEQDFFMRDIEEARASMNAVLHVGTNAVFRKKYVEEIGGYPTWSITEDMAIGMLLQAKGYKTYLVNKPLVLGLSVTTFVELVKQRDRWCRGNLQVLKKANPLFIKGLTLAQRIAYMDGLFYWFASVQKMIYILWPILFLLTGTIIIHTTMWHLLVYFLPFILGQFLVFEMLSPKTRSLSWTHIYEVAMAPHLSFSVLREMIGFKIGFNVTPKEVTSKKKYFQFRIAIPYLSIITFTLIGWFLSTFYLWMQFIDIHAYFINMGWSIYNFIPAVICIFVTYQQPIYRKSERIHTSNIALGTLYTNEEVFSFKWLDVNENGIGIQVEKGSSFYMNQSIFIVLDEQKIEGRVLRINGNIIGIGFQNMSVEQRKAIMRIYVENLHPFYNER